MSDFNFKLLAVTEALLIRHNNIPSVKLRIYFIVIEITSLLNNFHLMRH